MDTKRTIGITALVLGIVAAAWLAFSPYWAMSRLRDAVKSRDAETVNSYIDYDRLRSSLKAHIVQAAGADMAKQGGNAAGAAFAAALVGPMIDAMVQPAMMTGLLSGAEAKGPLKAAAITGEDVEIDRTGLKRFVLRPKGRPGGIVFEMQGFGWRLVDIDAGKEFSL